MRTLDMALVPSGQPSKKQKVIRPVELLCLEDNTSQINSTVPIDVPLFKPTPATVHFSGYEPFSTVTKTLRFRNGDYVARRIKVLPPKSPYFEISGGKRAASKVAPGMEVVFEVTFRPQEVREYSVDLVCCTEREKFIVQVKAAGFRPRLSLPSEVNFGAAAVKSTKAKSMLVQNTGSCVARFRLSCDVPEFSASPSEGLVHPGQMATLELSFSPQCVEPYEGRLLVEYLGGEKTVATVLLRGVAEDVDVHLSTNNLQLEPAYVSLSSQRTFKVRNASEIPVTFSWKQFQDSAEQEAERERLRSDLERMQQLEEAHLEEALSKRPPSDDEGSDGDLSGDEGHVSAGARAARSALATKYRHLRQALEKDDMVFSDETFEIKPLSGEVRALSEVDIHVMFRPDTAADYACTAYLDVVGREERLPVWLTGIGIGPKGALSYDVLDLGDVFVGHPYSYTLSIDNKGDIPAAWRLNPPESDAFVVEPTSGTLAVSGTQQLSVEFLGSTLGEFCELVDVELDGSNERLTCQFKGHVIGPTFHFDVDVVEYGLCSFAFAHERTLELTNTADIGMDYILKIPQDGQYGAPEFLLEPSSGSLAPGASVTIKVTFTPATIKVYDFYIVVDVPNVGEALLSLPVQAECKVADVSLLRDDLDLGECFLRYPYETDLILVNRSSELQARFDIQPQEKPTTVIGEYSCDRISGIIAPNSRESVRVTVRCNRLGNFRLPVATAIAGSPQPPLQSNLCATVKGPVLAVEPQSINWGPTPCLYDAPRSLVLTNTSCIPAPFRTFVKNARSKFRVDVRESVLAPNQSMELNAIACLDDTTNHKDQVHIAVAEGETVVVPVSARGTGTTIFCHERLEEMDFGSQFSSTIFERKVTLENKGRRPQTLKWTNETHTNLLLNVMAKRKKAQKDGVKFKMEDPEPVFTVSPAEIELRPRTAAIFTFRGYAPKVGQVEELLVCETKVQKEKNSRTVFRTTFKADVSNPLLEFSSPTVHFRYDWEPDVLVTPQTQELSMRNRSDLPVSFALKCPSPFHVEPSSLSLEANEAATVHIRFDPGYKGDRQSQLLEPKLVIAYNNHPQKDSVQLIGEINYPNLHFESKVVNFGCILNDTQMTSTMRITNSSKVPVDFHWAFLEDAEREAKRATEKKPYVPVNQVFDILPIRSHLEPDEYEDVDFVYYAHAGRKFKGICLADVIGGPEYQVTLVGEGSTVGFKLDKSSLNFGSVLYTQFKELEFTICNTGKVAFPFSVMCDAKDPEAQVFEISPKSGRVAEMSKQAVKVCMRPGLPRTFAENLIVECAHFNPIYFPVTGVGIYSTVSIALPRDQVKMSATVKDFGGSWASCLQTTRELVKGKKLHPDEPPPPPTLNLPLFAMAQPQVEEPPPVIKEKTIRITMAEVEAEANRRIFLDHLRGIRPPTGALRPTSKQSNRSASSVAGPAPGSDFVLAWHLCDFKHVVSGATKKRKFLIKNDSESGRLSWSVDKKLLTNTGFSVDPEKFVLAEGESTTFEVNFKAQKNLPLGDRELRLPITQRNGPVTMVVLRASICVPEVSCSHDALEFGDVWTGCGRTAYVQLHNISPVPAEWDFKAPLGKARDAHRFTLTPRSGVLKPSEKVNVAVEFAPVDDRPCSLRLPLKVANSPVTSTIAFTGKGIAAKLKFEPSLVEVGPILPFSDIVSTAVTLRNASDRPVEVFSLDFDTDFMTEEEQLRARDDLDWDNNLIRLPVREPGSQLALPDAPVEVDEAAPAPAPITFEDDGLEADEDALGGPFVMSDADNHETRWLDDEPSLRMRGMARDVMLVAPPLMHGPALAEAFASKHGYALTTPLAALMACSVVRSELGDEVRAALGLKSAAAPPSSPEEGVEEADAEAADAEPAADEAEEPAADEPEPEPEPAEAVPNPAKVAAVLGDVLAWRATRADAGRGLVVDASEPAADAPSLQAVAAACVAGLPNCSLAVLEATNEEIEATLRALDEECERCLAALEGVDDAPVSPPSSPQKDSEEEGPQLARDAALETEASRPPARAPVVPEALGGRVPGASDIRETAAEVRRRIASCLVDGKLRGAAEAPASVEEVAAPAPVAEADEEPAAEAEEPAAEEPEAAEPAPAEEPPVEAEDTAAPHKEFQEELVKARAAFKAAVDALPAPPAPEADGEEDAPAPPPALAPEERLVQFGVLEPIIVEADVEEAAAPAPAPLEASDITAAVVEAADDSTVATEDQQQPKEEAEEEPVPLEPINEELVIDLDSDAPLDNLVRAAPEPLEPLPEPGYLKIPEPVTQQLVRRPRERPSRAPQTQFILVPEPPRPEAEPTDEEAAAPAPAPSPEEIEELPEYDPETRSRWVIPARGSVRFAVKFDSKRVGLTNSSLCFEVVGAPSSEVALPCAGSCAVPTLNADPRNVFMSRVKNPSRPPKPPVSKRFVLSQNEYDFGPLLTWKTSAMKDDEADKVQSNCDILRMSNNGPFATTINLDFGREDTVFSVDEEVMELEPGETKDLAVWAFPTEVGEVKDTLYASVAQNPEPYAFALTCTGVEPVVEMEGPWSDADGVSEEESSVLLDFDRLLLGRSETREFVLKNTSLCAVAWKLDLSQLEEFDRELRVTPTEGVMKIHGSQRIVVSFTAVEAIEVAPTILINYSDDEGGLEERVKTLELPVKAEAYFIKAVAIDEEGDQDEKSKPGVLDFGQQRVGVTAQLGFSLQNRGKYDISYSFGFKREAYSNVFSVFPEQGTLAADASERIVVTFCAHTEVRLQANKDIICTISEPHTGEAVESFPVTVAASSLYPRFRVGPQRGIAFGCCRYNDEPRERTFEVRNEGLFSFAFCIGTQDEEAEGFAKLLGATPPSLLLGSEHEEQARELGLLPPVVEPPSQEEDEDDKTYRARLALFDKEQKVAERDFFAAATSVDDAAPPDAGSLTTKQFSITPSGGVVEPGQTLPVTVTFTPEGLQHHRDILRILVAGCDAEDKYIQSALNYELLAESRSPTIDYDNYYQIFEEQAVIGALEDDAPGGGLPMNACFAVAEKVFSFGTTTLMDDGKGIGERFKITNTSKVTSNVSFSINAKEGDDPRALNASDCFVVQPTQWEVPPHEHRYVTVYFHARELREYRAVFLATVAEQSEDAIGALEFELAGKGTLPSVSVEGVSHEETGECVPFGRLQVGRTRSRTITVRNDGVLDATALINFSAEDKHFVCKHAGTSVSLKPGASQDVPILFRALPQKDGDGTDRDVTAKLAIKVIDNRYEASSIELRGATFETDVSIEDLPDGEEDDLKFGNLALGDGPTSLRAEFTLRNVRNSTVRFAWPDHDSVTFVPQIGHIPAGGARTVVASFNAPEPSSVDEELVLATQQISFDVKQPETEEPAEEGTEEEPPASPSKESVLTIPKLPDGIWSDDAKIEREATDEEIAALDGEEPTEGITDGGTSLDGRRLVLVQVPEPEYEVIKEQTQTMKCVATADKPSYACETTSLQFNVIPMYQSLRATFQVENTSTIPLPYKMLLTNDGSPMTAASQRRPQTGGAVYEPIPCPFVVEPDEGSVAPSSSQTFAVHFSPVEVDDYQYVLDCVMPTLTASPGEEEPQAPIRITMRGRATRPACHIDLESDSDYLSRRAPNLLNEHGQKDQIESQNVRIVEVKSKGLRVQNRRRFLVTNPTASAYDFHWEPCGQPHASWKTLTPRGMILAGKRGEMIFEFTPSSTDTAEAFYRFEVPEHGISELFLFVGTVLEPRVAFDITRVDFGAIMLGSRCTETVHLVNSEHLPFAFNFEKPALDDESAVKKANKGPTLEITPLSGLVPPNGRAAVELSFRPTEEAVLNANLNCTVRKKKMKLSLNVKGEGYAVHSKLLLLEGTAAARAREEQEGTDGAVLDSGAGIPLGGEGITDLKPAPHVNVVDFGLVHLNQSASKILAIANTGKFNFDYVLDRGDSPNPMLVMTGARQAGAVRKNGRVQASLTFHPVTPCQLDGGVYTVSIAGKYEYILKLAGTGAAPNLRFSFLEHDFASCFTVTPGQPPHKETVVLRVSNQDPSQNLSLDCTLPRNKVLQVECGPRVLAPGEHVEIPIHFTPREIQDYAFQVPFLVNGVSTVHVKVEGKGVAARLELVQPQQADCSFGRVREGEDVTKHIQVVNRSARPLDFELLDEGGVLGAHDVTVNPRRVSGLKPKQVQSIEVRFAPQKRNRDFDHPLVLSYAGGLRPLAKVSGRATGMDVVLSTDTLAFGAVCEGSRRTRKLMLENAGDIATRFQWNQRTIGDLFTVSPLEGALRPETEIAFDVTFSPKAVNNDVRIDGMQLFVEGAAPLRLSCVGACVPQPDESKQTVSFESVARKECIEQVSIKNPTQKPIFVAPTLKHSELLEHFRAPAEVSIPAGGEASVDVQYFPLTMTSEEGYHSAELFVALPDGSAVLYNLQGKAGPPETLVIEPLTTPAKASLPITLPVQNWLSTPQHLDVAFELGEGSDDSTFLEGTSTFDVAGAETRNYVLRFYSYKVGTVTATATFTNPGSGEYITYEISVEVTEAGVVQTYNLEAPIRQTARRLITIDNPLPADAPVTFPETWWSCDDPHIRLSRVGSMQGSPEGVFELEFRPLVPHEKKDTELVFSIDELGEFKYKLTLGATEPPAIPQLRFEAPLGGAQVETFRFRAYPAAGASGKFSCSVQNAQFFEVSGDCGTTGSDDWEGEMVEVQVKFEPEALGAISDTLVIDGGPQGEYKCLLKGVCRRPEPRGPFTVEQGSSVQVEFRNVFGDTREFSFAVDHPDFSVGSAKASVNARSPTTCAVSFNPQPPPEDSTEPLQPVVSGRLLVDVEHNGEKITWVFYLKGLRKE